MLSTHCCCNTAFYSLSPLISLPCLPLCKHYPVPSVYNIYLSLLFCIPFLRPSPCNSTLVYNQLTVSLCCFVCCYLLFKPPPQKDSSQLPLSSSVWPWACCSWRCPRSVPARVVRPPRPSEGHSLPAQAYRSLPVRHSEPPQTPSSCPVTKKSIKTLPVCHLDISQDEYELFRSTTYYKISGKNDTQLVDLFNWLIFL